MRFFKKWKKKASLDNSFSKEFCYSKDHKKHAIAKKKNKKNKQKKNQQLFFKKIGLKKIYPYADGTNPAEREKDGRVGNTD